MDLTESTLESSVVFDGKLVKLRVDKVRLPNGDEARREIVVHRGAIAAVPLIDHENIILVRQFRQAAGEPLLEIPAGTLEVGEDPGDCVVRELEEETGYHANRLTLMFSSYLAPGYSTEMLHTYLAEELKDIGAHSEPDEFIELVILPLADAVEKILSGEIKDAKSICGILMAQRFISQRCL